MIILVENLAPGIQQIRIDRPERMNALGVATVDDLHAAIRNVATARAMKMMMAGEPVDAKTAEAWNIVQEMAPDDGLDARVLDYAMLLAARSPRGLRTLKRVVRTGMEQNLADGLMTERAALADIFASDDYAEGLRAFARTTRPSVRRVVFAE